MEKCKKCNRYLSRYEKCHCSSDDSLVDFGLGVATGMLLDNLFSSSDNSSSSDYSSDSSSFDGFDGGDFGGGGSSSDW